MNWQEYERLKSEINPELSADEYEEMIKEIVKELDL